MSSDKPYGFGSDPFGEQAPSPESPPVAPEPAAPASEPAAPPPGDQLAGEGASSAIPYEDHAADCVVICCSDHRFREPSLELVRRLGFSHPHMIQIPGGVAISLPLIAAVGFLSKAVDKLMEKAIRHTGVNDVICIAHEDCGGYKAENVKLIDTVVRKATGESVRDMQIEHLRKACRRLQLGLRGMTVRAFFADVVEEGPSPHVSFREVSLDRR
jgi:hypothetical protein